MADTVTELTFTRMGGQTPGLCRLTGTAAIDGAGTTAVIAPGNNDTNVSGSASLRHIVSYSALVNTSNANAFKAVKSYDTTTDRDIITITGTAADVIAFDIWGYDNGA